MPRLALAAAVVVGSDRGGAASGEAGEEALDRPQRDRELGGDLPGVRVLLPTAKKAGYGVGPEGRGA